MIFKKLYSRWSPYTFILMLQSFCFKMVQNIFLVYITKLHFIIQIYSEMKKVPVYIPLHPSTNAANEFMDALM